jgi:hypothetical protein
MVTEDSTKSNESESSETQQTQEIEEDLSRYTIGSSGKAPAMLEQEGRERKESEGKKEIIGFGLAPKKKKAEVPLEVRNKRLYIIGILLLILIVVLSAILFFLRMNIGSNHEEVVEIRQVQEDVEIEDFEIDISVQQLSREEISLEILNGSSVSGLAGKTAKDFENLGYEIIEVGNSEPTDTNIVLVNSRDSGKIDVLLEDLEDKLNIASVSGELEDSSASARIILGG